MSSAYNLPKKGTRHIILDGFDYTVVKCVATFLEKGTYDVPVKVSGISPLQHPPAEVQRTNALHRVNIVGQNENALAVTLRRNKGVVNLASLVAQQKPNLDVHLDVYKAAELYKIRGLSKAAIAGFHQAVQASKGHPEVQRVIGSSLPFPLHAID